MKRLLNTAAGTERYAAIQPLLGVMFALSMAATVAADFRVKWNESAMEIVGDGYTMRVQRDGFRFGFTSANGQVRVPPHERSGLLIGPADGVAVDYSLTAVQSDDECVRCRVKGADGRTATVLITPGNHAVKLVVRPDASGEYRVKARTGSLAPAFGLGDWAAAGRERTELSGFESDNLRATGNGPNRLVSSFVIFPRQRMGMVNFEPRGKILRLSSTEAGQGTARAREMPGLYYFFGEPRQIYASFLKARNEEAYKVYLPKPEFFGVGWEAFGALGWRTNQDTVRQHVQKYLDLGYPLKWMVVGSGFWPNEKPSLRATTSFGMWDKKRYPDPRRFIEYFHDRRLKFFLGLRISFIVDGPYAAEGVAKGYFLEDEKGQAKAFRIGFPASPCYLLDGQNAEAVEWYVGLCQKWADYGVDGFKEDVYGYSRYNGLRDDKLDPVNAALMDAGFFVMVRNGYIGSSGDTHRYNDFNFDQNQDRGPINGLALAYSGFPYVYPDIVGGTFGEGRPMPKYTDPRLRAYMMRYAQYASVHPSMAMGMGPWNFGSEQVNRVVLDAAKLHDRLHFYIYSAAVETYRDGFPHTMTPLPLLWPDDETTYNLENASRRGYQWMIGPSLMATPLYGDDYASATTRDVYLPHGTWLDYDTGEAFSGPTTLVDYSLPVGKTPLFVGGKGILAEQQDGILHARLYPVANARVEHVFYGFDAKPHATVRVEVGDWDAPLRVTNGGTPVAAKTVRHALEFLLDPGGKYVVTNR